MPAQEKQVCQLKGVVLSEKTGENLMGINIVIEGTRFGASTDLEGKFVINKIPYATYTIRVSGVGLQTKIISGYVISKPKLEVTFTLADESYNLAEISVTAIKIKSTEAAVLAERKKMGEISDIISAEQIKRTPDATSGDALKRVTGLTVVDNKFVVIRGISDRYNSAMIDGSVVTSTEAGKKGFSFDLLPSNLLENTTVIKSASPDLPGDFSGGLVKMRTLDFPGENSLKVNYGSTYNTLSTGTSFNRTFGGNKDWLGFDDGTRALPSFAFDNELGKKLPNTWAPKSAHAPVNSSFAITSANQIMFGEGQEMPSQLGSVIALTYRNSYQKNELTRNDGVNSRFYTGAKDDYSVLWGAIANLSYKFGGGHMLSFRNTFNQSSSDQVSVGSVVEQADSKNDRIYEISWAQRSNYNGQLAGEHRFLLSDKSAKDLLHISWRASVASSVKENPDKKRVFYSADFQSDDNPNPQFEISTNQRSWDKMNERAFAYALDNDVPLAVLLLLSDGKLKFGGYYEEKKTDFRIRYFDVALKGYNAHIAQLPIDSVYMPQNFMSTKSNQTNGLFYMTENDRPTDSYRGEMNLLAAYLMLDVPLMIMQQEFRLSGGARLENSLKNIFVPQTNDPNGKYSKQQKKNIDILPSLNLIYKINELTNFRFAYYHTVNRPDFRELAPTVSYDYVLNESFGGNPNLQRAYIKNIDIRAEVFPEIGEVFAVSYFTKVFSGAIEEQMQQAPTPLRLYFNSQYAENRGWEFEVKKSLGFAGNYLSNFVISANYTIVDSKVKVTSTTGNSFSTRDTSYYRPLQGQAPYSLNLSLSYIDPWMGTSINILYNKSGRRLQTVGFQASDIYEEPVDLVDLTINQPITSMFELKLSIRNLGDKDRIRTRDNGVYENIRQGRSVSLLISYKL